MAARSRRTLTTFWLTTSLLILGCANAILAAETNWRDLKHAAIEAEFKSQDKQAASLYKESIAATPKKCQNDVAEMYARLGVLSLELKDYKQACLCVTDLGESMSLLNKSATCEPEVLTHVAFFSDAYEQSLNQLRHSRIHRERAKEFYQQAVALRNMLSATNPADALDHQLHMARYFADLKLDADSEEALKDILRKMPSVNSEYPQAKLYLAAVQFKLGKPEPIKDEAKKLSKKDSQVVVHQKVSEAHLWAANYDQAKLEAEGAMALLRATKKPDLKESAAINNLFGEIYSRSGDWAKAENYFHKCMDIEGTIDKTTEEYRKALKNYEGSLRQQHRDAEADVIKKTKPKERKELEWILGDEERKLLNEERQKKSPQPK